MHEVVLMIFKSKDMRTKIFWVARVALRMLQEQREVKYTLENL